MRLRHPLRRRSDPNLGSERSGQEPDRILALLQLHHGDRDRGACPEQRLDARRRRDGVRSSSVGKQESHGPFAGTERRRIRCRLPGSVRDPRYRSVDPDVELLDRNDRQAEAAAGRASLRNSFDQCVDERGACRETGGWVDRRRPRVAMRTGVGGDSGRSAQASRSPARRSIVCASPSRAATRRRWSERARRCARMRATARTTAMRRAAEATSATGVKVGDSNAVRPGPCQRR